MATTSTTRFTPTQTRILAVLSDGMAHRRAELQSCLYDDMATPKTLRAWLSVLRKKLRPMGQDIICELRDRTICYRHVRLLASATDGKG